MRARDGSVSLLVLAASLVAVLAPGAAAAAQATRVVVVPGLELADLAPLEDRAALGLLAPGSGPTVSGASALAALERGRVRNSLRGGLPAGPALITAERSRSVPRAGPVIVLGLPEGGEQQNTRRYPIAVIGPGYHGLLVSPRTKIPGLVSVADVAPTARGEGARLSSTSDPNAEQTLRELDERIAANGDVRALASLLALVVILLLAYVLPRGAVLGFATALGANLVLGVAGLSAAWVVLLVIGVATALGGALALVARSPLAVGAILAAVVVGYLLALGLDGPSVALSPLGPTQNSRFYGLSNLLSALLLVPALAGATLIRAALGWAAAIVFAAAALVTIAGSRFGADGGTAIVLCVAYAVLAVEIAETRRRAAVAIVAAVAVVVAALIALDAVTGASSHLTEAIGSGPGSFAGDLRDRVVLSFERATEHWYLALLVALGALVLLLLAVRLAASGLPRSVRALPLSLAVAVAVSFVVNDSPLDVVSVGLVGYIAAQAYVLAEPDAVSPDY
jgi:hypothetical protein